MATGLIRLEIDGEAVWAVRTPEGDAPLRVGLDDLLRRPLDEAQASVEAAGAAADLGGTLLAPVESQEVWGAGVTYERSREGRIEESTEGGVYDRIYVARRPEVFFKATASRVVGPGQPIGVRADSPWNAPEPELGLVLNAGGEIFGYVVGNDVSSRSIEGENPLYLPQAKIYDRSCALGPGIVPVWAAPALPFDITCRVERRDEVAFAGRTSTVSLTRRFSELAAWLTAALTFPVGAVLLTGTGIVPDESFSLRPGDVVTIDVAGLGTLTNPVVLVGRDLDQEQQ
jgi:2-dehydro-3-deoxy-D-arabinonate dehydratase